MIIDRLKIAGFKSFADPVDVPIGIGITGIVGPNGCGKSNLIEALRWAMGETSAKRMRAEGGMDDVIFGGTDIRPPRASCEVTISIDNSERLAPLEFNSENRLNVSRRIDRGDGSSYKVNGKAARARDVQVLFKDAGVGAGSSALVSQGKVGLIISSKPTERRNILEEAAGVAGLSSRRHEAELRLKGTEQNLERAEDTERGLSEQLNSLRRQARQAKRRNDIDGLIRAAEATAFLVRWRMASAKVSQTDLAFKANEDRVMERMIALKAAETALASAEELASPAVKARMDAETAFALAKARVESVRKEAQSAKSALLSAQKMVERTKTDMEREKLALGNSGEEYEELKDKKQIALDDKEYDTVLIEEAVAEVLAAKEALDDVMLRVQAMAEAMATTRAERAAVERRHVEALSRKNAAVAKFEAAHAKLAEYVSKLTQLPPPGEEIRIAQEALDIAEQDVVVTVELQRETAEAEAEARKASGDVAAELSAVQSELRLLGSSRTETKTAGSEVRTEEGLEAAVAAAFGDGLSASLGSGESRWWVASALRIAHPAGTKPLSSLASVPAELEAALSGIGVAVTNEAAAALSADLKPGQAIVTPDGKMWRWDGFRSDGNSGAVEEIRRAARLRHLDGEIVRLEKASLSAAALMGDAAARAAQVQASLSKARETSKSCRIELDRIRLERDGIERERTDLSVRIASAEETQIELREAAEAETAHLEECAAAVAALPSLVKQERELEDVRAEASRTNAAYEKRREALDKVKRDAEARILMLQNIDQQMHDFNRRIVTAKELIADLGGRLEEGLQECENLAASEALAPDAELVAGEDLEAAAAFHEEAVSKARISEEAVSEARTTARDTESQLAVCREDRARLLAEMKAALETSQELTREIGERLSCEPDALQALSGTGPDDELPDLASCEVRVQRLVRERVSIGTVNLLAEQQVAEVEAKLGDTNKSRDELREAVKRLRATITEFNREARDRLTEAFALIDGHFRDLFARMFRGGHAYLKLSGSEDILEAGLEIYASPPGKKLQTMSLLSGGEQALTALALIFAAFLIRPAPVCVLDEVDAPLDDANVDRLCPPSTWMLRSLL